MDRLVAKDAILRTIYDYIKSEDELDRSLCLSQLEPDRAITVDLSRYVGAPVEDMKPSALWDAVVQSLSGFEATHHLLGNEVIDFADDSLSKAHFSCKASGYHCVKVDDRYEDFMAYGTLEIDVELWQGKWVIRKLAIIRSGPVHRADLYQKAMENVGKGLGRKPK